MATLRFLQKLVVETFVGVATAAILLACSGGPSPATKSTPSDSANDTPQSNGGRIDTEAVRQVIRDNFPRFRRCYEAGLAGDPNMKGVVGLAFVIAEDGSVEGANVDHATLTDATVQSCVVDVSRTLKFSAPTGGKVQVRSPISFKV